MSCEYTSDLPVTGTFVIVPSANAQNIYSEALVPYATVTTILTFVVATDTFNISGFIGWGDTCGEFLLKVNGITKGGGRTTAAEPITTPNYLNGPVPTILGDVITITAEHYTVTSHTMKANLIGG